MRLTPDLLVAVDQLRAWALGRLYVKRMWIYGSRATGTALPQSDLDVAIEIDPVGNDEDSLDSIVSERCHWVAQLQPHLPYTLHLEWYDPKGRNAVVQHAVEVDGILIFDRTP